MYVRNSGIVHALLSLERLDDELGHPVAGATWAGMVVESMISAAGRAAASFYRTLAGAEIELVVEGRANQRHVIEIKRSTAPKVSKGFWIRCEDLGAADALVIYVGHERIPLGIGSRKRSGCVTR